MFKLTREGQEARHLKKEWAGLHPELPVWTNKQQNTHTHTHLAKVATLVSVRPLAARLRWVRVHSSC